MDTARDVLDKDNRQYLKQYDAKLQQNLEEIFKYTTQDEAKKGLFRNELQTYVQQLHADFEQMERRRLADN